MCVNASFAGNWDEKMSHYESRTARSRHGYIIHHAGCPVLAKSQLQMEIALSTTESERMGWVQVVRHEMRCQSWSC